MEWLKNIKPLPPGYFIIDADEEPHDGDAEDGRYGLYCGEDFENCAFLGNLHDMKRVVEIAWEYYSGERK